MQYFGGKQRIAKSIVAFLLPHQNGRAYFFEPFVGGCNIIPLMQGKRFASDKNEYVIAMYIALQDGWEPPKNVTVEKYYYVKEHKDENKALTGFVGIGCSYSGKWFGGFAKNKRGDNYCLSAHNSLLKLKPLIEDVQFKCLDFVNAYPRDSLIYCDPPYKNTTQYGATGDFDADAFWSVVRRWSMNNTVFISEYVAPDDFKCVWQHETRLEIRNKNNVREPRIEKLFQWKGS